MDSHEGRNRLQGADPRRRYGRARRPQREPGGSGPRPHIPVRRVGVAVAVAVVSTVLPAAVLGARALVLQDPNPSPSYPVEPRTLAGADPFALVPKPQECARSRDRAGRADYFPLSRPRPSRRASNPFAPGAPATTALTLEN